MKNRRLIIPLQWQEGLMFDEKDTIHAYQILGRARKVKINDRDIEELPDDQQIVDFKLVPASSVQSAPKQLELESIKPEPAASVMDEQEQEARAREVLF